METILKLLTFIIFFFTAHCFAAQAPANALQIQSQKKVESEFQDEPSFLSDLHLVSQLPETTYRYLENIFASFYKKLSFSTVIVDSTFEDNLNSELISVPLIATNKQGVHIELFGNFSDPARQYLSNLSADHALHDYIANSEQIDFSNSTLSLGAGISFNTGQSSKIKIIISNNEMPGYGNSTTLVGFETRF